MRHRFFIRGSVRPSVSKAVGRSVGLSVRQAFLKNKENQYFRPNKCRRRFTRLISSILASPQDALYVHGCTARNVRDVTWPVCHSIGQKESWIITSSCMHFINTRAHCWPYGTYFARVYCRNQRYYSWSLFFKRHLLFLY